MQLLNFALRKLIKYLSKNLSNCKVMQIMTNIQISPAQDAKLRRRELIKSTYLSLLRRGMLKTSAVNETARIVGVSAPTVWRAIDEPNS